MNVYTRIVAVRVSEQFGAAWASQIERLGSGRNAGYSDWVVSWVLCFIQPYTCAADCVWNVKAHAQKPDFVFRRNGRVHLNRLGREFSQLLSAEVCASAVVILNTPCSEVVCRVLATHSICQFSPSLPLPCVTVYHNISTGLYICWIWNAVNILFSVGVIFAACK